MSLTGVKSSFEVLLEAILQYCLHSLIQVIKSVKTIITNQTTKAKLRGSRTIIFTVSVMVMFLASARSASIPRVSAMTSKFCSVWLPVDTIFAISVTVLLMTGTVGSV